MTLDATNLLPGDVLLYFDSRSLVDWVIAFKTWNRIAHIEIYTGHGMSVASRNGIGVNRYPLRTEGLVCVRRSGAPLDMASADRWFQFSRDEKYDFKGLLCFYLAVKQGSMKKMFCSEFALRWCRHAGLEPFNPAQDADKTPPSYFWVTPAFETVWPSKE